MIIILALRRMIQDCHKFKDHPLLSNDQASLGERGVRHHIKNENKLKLIILLYSMSYTRNHETYISTSNNTFRVFV